MIWQKRILTAALILSFTNLNCGIAPESKAPPKEIVKLTEKEKILMAFIAVESSGNWNAYNKSEKAAGILQIKPIRLRDINRVLKTNYKLSDRYDSTKSVHMFIRYQEYYDADLNLEEWSKNWNGNPHWKSLKYTSKYFNKIKLAYSSIID